jgi:hypothetical protein
MKNEIQLLINIISGYVYFVFIFVLFCFNVCPLVQLYIRYYSTVSNLYNNDVIIYKIKKSRENSFVCERVYLICLLQHWSNS